MPPRKKSTPKKKSTVNKAGNYTKPEMRKRIFNRIKAGSKGGNPGQWSARKRRCWPLLTRKQGAVTSNHDSRFSPVRLYRNRRGREAGQQRHVLS